MEFNNGNYYLEDTLEIALLEEESGNVYHSYEKINYSLPKQMQLLTGIANRTIETHGVPFRNVMDGLVEFIRRETTEQQIIKAHGGYVPDFLILLASCMKHNYNDFPILAELDSRPGLDAPCAKLNIGVREHSAQGGHSKMVTKYGDKK